MGNTFSAKYFFDFITNFSNFSCDNIIQEYFLKCCYSDVSNLLSPVGSLFLAGFTFPPVVDTIVPMARRAPFLSRVIYITS